MDITIDCFEKSITLAKDIVLTLVSIVTTVFAYWGLKRWRQELTGKVEFDVARVVLRSMYKLRDEVMSCRSPFIAVYEFPPDYDPFGYDKKMRRDGFAYAYSNRMKPVMENLRDFDAATQLRFYVRI